MSYNGPLWLNLVGSWVPIRTSPHPRDTIRTPPMLVRYGLSMRKGT